MSRNDDSVDILVIGAGGLRGSFRMEYGKLRL